VKTTQKWFKNLKASLLYIDLISMLTDKICLCLEFKKRKIKHCFSAIQDLDI